MDRFRVTVWAMAKTRDEQAKAAFRKLLETNAIELSDAVQERISPDLSFILVIGPRVETAFTNNLCISTLGREVVIAALEEALAGLRNAPADYRDLERPPPGKPIN